MDLRIGAARKLALAISGWFGGAKVNSVTDGQLTTCNNVFPQSVDVVKHVGEDSAGIGFASGCRRGSAMTFVTIRPRP